MHAWIGSITILSVLVLSCVSSNFQGRKKHKQPVVLPPAPIPIPTPQIKTDAFKPQVIKGALVDVVFAFDTSESMGEERDRLQTVMASFLGKLASEEDSLDYHVYLIGQNFLFPQSVTSDPTFSTLDAYVDSHNALFMIHQFLLGYLPGQSAPLRSDSRIEVIVITDDNARDSVDTWRKTVLSALRSLVLDADLQYSLANQATVVTLIAGYKDYPAFAELNGLFAEIEGQIPTTTYPQRLTQLFRLRETVIAKIDAFWRA